MRGQHLVAAAAAATAPAMERAAISADHVEAVISQNQVTVSAGERKPVDDAAMNVLSGFATVPVAADLVPTTPALRDAPVTIGDAVVPAAVAGAVPAAVSQTAVQSRDVAKAPDDAALALERSRANERAIFAPGTDGAASAPSMAGSTGGEPVVLPMAGVAVAVRAAVPVAGLGAAVGATPLLAVSPGITADTQALPEISTAPVPLLPVLATGASTVAAHNALVPSTAGDVVSAAPTAFAAPAAINVAAPAMLPIPTAVTPVATSPAQPAALAGQVTRAIFTLVGVAPGEHTMVVKVTPENLGPLTVRAHITPDGMRLELFAPSEQSREVLRALLPDLRRDIAGFGANAQLDLSSENEPEHSDRELGDDRSGHRRSAAREADDPRSLSAHTLPSILFGPTSTIDVLA